MTGIPGAPPGAVLVGIDDTDTTETRGTNRLARGLVAGIADAWRCLRIVRHQLLVDDRVPYTSKNGSASLLLQPRGDRDPDSLAVALRAAMLADAVPGSDPGLCVTTAVPDAVEAFGLRCKEEVVTRREATELARAHGIHLVGLGGTEDGVIGALAAVGLALGGDDGRIVVNGDHPDDLTGTTPLQKILERGVQAVLAESPGGPLPRPGDRVDVGKHLRPNLRGGRAVLFVAPAGPAAPGAAFVAIRRT